jgi:hypothetical protein
MNNSTRLNSDFLLDHSDEILENYNNYDKEGGILNFKDWQIQQFSIEEKQKYDLIITQKLQRQQELDVIEKEWMELGKKVEILRSQTLALKKKENEFILPDCSVCGTPSTSKYCEDCW